MTLLNKGIKPVEVPPNTNRQEARKLVRQQHNLGNRIKHTAKEISERKKRRSIKNRKVAICLGCGKPNYQCKCSDHKTQHFETQISYNWGKK